MKKEDFQTYFSLHLSAAYPDFLFKITSSGNFKTEYTAGNCFDVEKQKKITDGLSFKLHSRGQVRSKYSDTYPTSLFVKV